MPLDQYRDNWNYMYEWKREIDSKWFPYDGVCSGIINLAKSKKYSVSARQGIMSTKLVLQPVDDIFDAD